MSLKLHTRNHPSLQVFQWDSVDAIPIYGLGGQNDLKTFEMAIRHKRQTTRTELERVFCRLIFGRVIRKIKRWTFFWNTCVHGTSMYMYSAILL